MTESPTRVQLLRRLCLVITESGPSELAFAIWANLKTRLSAAHRCRVLKAWNQSTEFGDNTPVLIACQEVIRDMSAEKPDTGT